MSNDERQESAGGVQEAEGRFSEQPRSRNPRWPVRLGWTFLRGLVPAVTLLVVAHWLAAVWANGWFQLAGALVACVGLPALFHFLIRRRVRAGGGTPRFRRLTLVALVNLPLLLWVGARSPSTFADAVYDEGLGSLKWIARTLGATESGDGSGDNDTGDIAADALAEADAGSTEAEAGEDGMAPDPLAASSSSEPEAALSPRFPSGQPISFENESGQMVIQASVAGGEPMAFVLDTGATYSTLNRAALARLGVAVPEDAPVRTMQTAGGEAAGPMVLLDSVTVGDQSRAGVTFWICEPCAAGDAVGLLGLNVWQGYLLTIDPADQTVWLQPKESPTNRLFDVESFLDIHSPTSRIEGETVFVDLLLSNSTRRDIQQAVVLVTALDENGAEIGAITVDAGLVPGLGSSMATGTMPKAGTTSHLTFKLIDARW